MEAFLRLANHYRRSIGCWRRLLAQGWRRDVLLGGPSPSQGKTLAVRPTIALSPAMILKTSFTPPAN